MPKDDPLGQQGPAPRTLWLDRANNAQACRNYWRGWRDYLARQGELLSRTSMQDPQPAVRLVNYSMPIDQAEAVWEIAWAAAVAAHSYIWEGRTEP